MVFAALGRIDFRLQFSIDWHDPRIRQVFTLMLPVTIGLGIVNLDQLINSVFGTLVSKEAPRAIDNAFRIYMLPQGLFSVAVATVLFPTLSRMAASHDVRNMRRTIGIGMRQINLLLIPSAVFMLVLTTPIVRLLFERGQFDATSTSLVSEALFWFAFSLPFGGLNLLLTRVFFSVQRPWIPTRLAALNIIVDIVVSIGLYKPLGIAGLIIGTVAANAVMTALQFHRLRIGFNGSLEGAQTTMITARILVASVLLGAVSWVVWTRARPPLRRLAARADHQRRRGRRGGAVRLRARGPGDAHPRGPSGQPADPHAARAGLGLTGRRVCPGAAPVGDGRPLDRGLVLQGSGAARGSRGQSSVRGGRRWPIGPN